jgi:hypothetical protein
MRTRTLILVCLMAAGFARAADEPKDDLQPIFNGKDLSGWQVPKENPWWKVVDGVLVGENSPENNPKLAGNVLYTEKSYGDVIVESDFRFKGEVDTGIILRKDEAGKKDLQVQIGVSRSLKKDMTGSVYVGKYPEEGQAKDAQKLLKDGDWNTIRVEARGDTYKIWLNGQQVVTYKDPAYPKSAPIGLQVHGGLKMKAEFRNVRAKALDEAK